MLGHAKVVLLAGEGVEQRVQARGDVPAPLELVEVEPLVQCIVWRHLQSAAAGSYDDKVIWDVSRASQARLTVPSSSGCCNPSPDRMLELSPNLILHMHLSLTTGSAFLTLVRVRPTGHSMTLSMRRGTQPLTLRAHLLNFCTTSFSYLSPQSICTQRAAQLAESPGALHRPALPQNGPFHGRSWTPRGDGVTHLAPRLPIAIQAVALLQAQQVLYAAGVREARAQLLRAVAQQALAHGRSVRCSQKHDLHSKSLLQKGSCGKSQAAQHEQLTATL